jgi:steroid delta-isomerase-like uncharacterized protein
MYLLVDFLSEVGAHWPRVRRGGVMSAGKDLWTEVKARYNEGDLAGWAALYASDAVCTDPTGRYEGRAAILANLEGASKPFSDIRMETSLLIEEGDTVVGEWTVRGTHTGPLPMPDGTEISATGKAFEILGVTIWTVRDGMVTNQRDYFDSMAMMSQLGLMPVT